MKTTLDRLDSIRQELVNTVSSLEPDIYSEQPAEGEWSVGEIVHHLCLVEARVIHELERAVAQPPRRVGFLSRLIPTSIVSLRFKRVAAPGSVKPVDPPSRKVALENLERARKNLKALCATHGKERLRNLVFKHPYLGEIDGVAAVSSIGHHEKRHSKQIREVLQKLNSASKDKLAADSRG